LNECGDSKPITVTLRPVTHTGSLDAKKNGEDRLYGERLPILIDEDAREEYWTKIRNSPENKHLTRIN
jgi:hypothetical protein